MIDYSPKIMERKMKFLASVIKLYLIIWIITPALGICEECNNSLGLSQLDIDRIWVSTSMDEIRNIRGYIRLSDEWPVFRYYIGDSDAFRIDLVKVYNITGMIIKGEEGNGTGDLLSFNVYYSNNSDIGSLKFYVNEKGKYEDFKGTTKKENIRYQQFYPSFLARYFWIRMTPNGRNHFGYMALQIDILGCNITGIPCNDILITTRGVIYGDAVGRCLNNNHLEIKFAENGIYKIRTVNITITDEDLLQDILDYEAYMLFYIYKSGDETENDEVENVGQSIIFDRLESSVRSLQLCINSDVADEKKIKDVYNYTIIEVRGCPIGP